jgi:hypothetical protein
VVADNRFDSSLILTAPSGAATVRVVTVSAAGKSAPQDVEVPAGRTVEAELKPPGGDDASYGAVITPRPGSAPVYASRVLATGKGEDYLFTVLPIVPAPMTIRLPDTADSQTALTP